MPAVIDYNIVDIAKIVNGQAHITNATAVVKNLSVDSRTILNADSTLFFALTAQRDGHSFIADAYKNGVRNFVVALPEATVGYTDANFIIVDSAISALQQLAQYHRSSNHINTIAIAGSNGKTVVKEWLYQLLSSNFNIVRSPKSYNSQIGVPLSVWQINKNHNLAIFEAGISKHNEMQALAEIIKPNIGVLTNIGTAHAEGFENKETKLLEKLRLFKDVDLFVYSPDYVKNVVIPGKSTFTWSFSTTANLQVKAVLVKANTTEIVVRYLNKDQSVFVPFADAASIENVVICCATLLAMGTTMDEVAAKLSGLLTISMRLQLLDGIDNCSIIDDSYSADISSLSIALDFLNQQNQYPKRTLILSDLQESGKTDEELYTEVANLIAQKKIHSLIGIGNTIRTFSSKFSLQATYFDTTEAFINALPSLKFGNETILIKGARKFAFEKIVKRLTQKSHETVLEINLNAILQNLQFYRSKLSKGVKTMVMVKASSYGSGSFEIANLLQYQKVDYLAVAFADEGIALRKAGITTPIMVMSPAPATFDAMLRFNLEPEIYSIALLKAFINFLPTNAKNVPVHIKLDTGMHRLGFEPHEINDLCATLVDEKVHVNSVFTHLVGSDDENFDAFTKQQADSFTAMYNLLVERLNYKPIRHILNTSGITRWSNYQFDMVRIGIGLHGFDGALKNGVEGLSTVAALKTTVSQVKTLTVNDTVGYGRRGGITGDTQIATIKIGYADGYLRAFGNGIGKVLIAGKLVPTIGSICMDMCMVNVTGLNVLPGDEVIIFDEHNSIADLAVSIGTIPYEILTNISQRVKRIYFYE